MNRRKVVIGALLLLLLAAVRIPVEAQSGVDLSVSVVSSGYTINGELEYTITITNNGDTVATGISFASILPEQSVLISATSPAPSFCPVQSDYKVVCNFIDPLSAATSVSAVIVTHPYNIGVKFNTVTAASVENDLNPDDNTDFVYDTLSEVALAQLQLENTVSGPALIGQTQTYQLIVTQLGDDDAQNVVVTAALPANITFVSAAANGAACPAPTAGVLTCTLGTLTNGDAPVSVVIEIIPTTTGTFVNLASVMSSTFDPNIVDNAASSTFTIAPDNQNADVQVTKTLEGEGSYLITVTNAGPQDASYIRLVDTLPAGTTFENLSYSLTTLRQSGGDPVCSVITMPYPTGGGSVECLVPSLAVGEIIEFEITVLHYTTGLKINQVTVSAAQPDLNLLNNQASVDETITAVGLADLRVEYLGGSINFEGNFNYNVNVLNIQDDDAQQVVFKQLLPSDVVIVSAQNTATGELCAVLPVNLIRCELGVMSPSPANSINVLVVAALPDLDPFTLISAVRSASFDANLSDNYLETLIDPNPATETPTATVVTETPTVETSTPTIETATPTVETATPTVETATPTIETATPTVETATPTVATTTPTVETATPTIETPTPTIETATPTVATATPTIETATSTIVTATPTIETSTPTLETQTPTVETATPTVETATPTVATATPTVETATPTIETPTPSVETATPTVATATPTVETATPTIETATSTIVTATPTIETSTPTLETPTPTVETATPTIETATPTVATATPTVATATPTITTATPTIATATPTFATATPTIATATPTFQTATPTLQTSTPTATIATATATSTMTMATATSTPAINTLTPTPTATLNLVTSTAATGTPTATPTSNTATPTLTASPTAVELLVNGSFEAGASIVVPWTVKNGMNDTVKCNKDKTGDGIPDKIIANSGNCAFRFKGSLLENSKLQQTIPLSSAIWTAGDVLDLSVFVDAKSPSTIGKIKLRVKYGDGTLPGKVNLDLTLTTSYTQFDDRYTLTSGSVTKIKLEVQNRTTSGKVYIDDARLLLLDGTAGLLPVPPAL